MERQDGHLSPDLIRSFVYGLAALRPDQFQHLQDCDHCSDAWVALEAEAKKRENSDYTKKKTA